MYVKITNGAVDQYPYTVGNLRRDNPNTSFPRQISSSILESYGVMPVVMANMPDVNPRNEVAEQESQPSLIDGSWVVGWSVRNKSADEVQEYDTIISARNRGRRNDLLAETDFYALSDVTMSAEMTAYRQALRDITTHANWPHLNDDDWPTKPE